ncbi:MAG: hypothetical protein F6K18_22820 [Okeania sp. SIO2C2]|nr:hypothetical protein [Okeania sp. SIO2C2]NEP89436.1 hypothetical protein [Okeania sp. SIO2C2]
MLNAVSLIIPQDKTYNDGGVRSQESGVRRKEEEGESFFITNYPDMI